MKYLEILVKDGCTKSEAENHLSNGTIVYEDLEDNLEKYIKEFESKCMDEEFIEAFKKMIETQKPLKDWGIVEAEGHRYYIEYML